jgi:hypothetical protein
MAAVVTMFMLYVPPRMAARHVRSRTWPVNGLPSVVPPPDIVTV